MAVLTLLPPESGDFTILEDALKDAARRGQNLNNPELVVDEEMNAKVVQLLGDSASIEMPCQTGLQYLVVQLKNLDRYTCFE